MRARPFTPAPFAPRPVRAAGVLTRGGYRIKAYEITLPCETIDAARFTPAVDAALGELSKVDPDTATPGLGFVILHQGSGWDYLVLCTWINQNELATRIWRAPRRVGAQWTLAAGDGSFCVWDLEVMWHERNAYVRHVLTPNPDPEGYLADVLSRDPRGGR